MLVGFIGAPCSGKTTTAAKLFAELKDSGVPTEFVLEEARKYIAQLRRTSNKVILTDQDQLSIMQKQYDNELLMKETGKDELIVVADSSALNAILYMSPEFRSTPEVVELAKKATSNYALAFLCQPINIGKGYDPNRVHSFEQSIKIHEDLQEVLLTFAPELKTISLYGDSHYRLNEAVRAVNDYYYLLTRNANNSQT